MPKIGDSIIVNGVTYTCYPPTNYYMAGDKKVDREIFLVLLNDSIKYGRFEIRDEFIQHVL